MSSGEGPQAVVLKIRRRKFQRTPQKGEVVVTRRLFRTGESEYLLNASSAGCATSRRSSWARAWAGELRDHRAGADRAVAKLQALRAAAIIEEAAGITRFKTKKRLAELRLESAKQNLARVDDISRKSRGR